MLLFIGCSNNVETINKQEINETNLKVEEVKNNSITITSICGNGKIETGETSQTCCLDVSCSNNFQCVSENDSNYCKEIKTILVNELKYTKPNSLILEPSNLEKGYRVTQSFKIDENNIYDIFNRMSSSKVKYFQIIGGYERDFSNSVNQNEFAQTILIFNSSEKANEFFEDRNNYYIETFTKSDFNYAGFDKVNHYVLKDEIYGERAYRFLILHENVIILNTYYTKNYKDIDKYELTDLLNTQKGFFENYDSKKELPNEIIIEKPYKLGSSPYDFKNLNVVEQNGFKMAIVDYEFERKGETWGKLKEIKIVVENQGSNEIFPTILMEIKDKDTKLGSIPQKAIDLDVYLSGNSYIEVTLTPDLSFPSWDKDKDVKVNLMEYDKTLLVSTKKITASELSNIK